jgi:hypothetical protein
MTLEETLKKYNLSYIKLAIIGIIILIIYYFYKKQKKEKFGALAYVMPGAIQYLLNDLAIALGGMPVVGPSAGPIAIDKYEYGATRDMKEHINERITNMRTRLQQIKTEFNNFIESDLNTKINNKYNYSISPGASKTPVPLSFSVDISGTISNLIIDIKPNQNLNNILYYDKRVEYGMYKSRESQIFIIVKIATSASKCDIHLLNITDQINKFNKFLKTHWSCIGEIASIQGFGTELIYYHEPCEGGAKNIYIPNWGNQENYQYNFRSEYKYAFRFINRTRNTPIFPEIVYNSKVSQSFTDVPINTLMYNSPYILKFPQIYSNIEIFSHEFSGECRTNDNKYPPYFDFPNTPTLNDCKNICKNKVCTDYNYNQNNKMCKIYNPKILKTGLPPDPSALKGTSGNNSPITQGTNDNNWKCYSQKNQDGYLLDALPPPPPPPPPPAPLPTWSDIRELPNGAIFNQISNIRCNEVRDSDSFKNLILDEAINKCAILSNLGGSNKPCIGIKKQTSGYIGCTSTLIDSSLPNNSWIKTRDASAPPPAPSPAPVPPAPSPAPPAPAPAPAPAPSWSAYLSKDAPTYNGSCRTSDNKYPSWKSLQRKPYETCKTICKTDTNCKAYAYSIEGRGNCQIFTTTPGTGTERLQPGTASANNTTITKGDGSILWKCYKK